VVFGSDNGNLFRFICSFYQESYLSITHPRIVPVDILSDL
jgi:hypothetical protein